MKLRLLAVIATIIFGAGHAAAQDGFTGASSVLAVDYKGSWGTGNLTTESYDLFETGPKAEQTHWCLQGNEFIATGPGVSLYTGGISVQPNLTGLLNKTNIPAGALSFSANASVGVGLPSTGPSVIGALFSGTLNQKLTSNLSWQTVTAGYGRFGSQGFAFASTGLKFFFGGQ